MDESARVMGGRRREDRGPTWIERGWLHRPRQLRVLNTSSLHVYRHEMVRSRPWDEGEPRPSSRSDQSLAILKRRSKVQLWDRSDGLEVLDQL